MQNLLIQQAIFMLALLVDFPLGSYEGRTLLDHSVTILGFRTFRVDSDINRSSRKKCGWVAIAVINKLRACYCKGTFLWHRYSTASCEICSYYLLREFSSITAG